MNDTPQTRTGRAKAALFILILLAEVGGAVYFSEEAVFWMASAVLTVILFVESPTFAAMGLVSTVVLLNVFVTVRDIPAYRFVNEANHLELVDLFVVLALIAVFMGRSMNSIKTYKANGTELPMFALFSFAAISLLWAGDTAAGWVVLISFSMCIAIFYLPAFLLKDRAGVDAVLWTIVITSVFAAVFSLSSLYYDNVNFSLYQNKIFETPFFLRLDVIFFENIKERVGGYSDPNRMAFIFNTVLLTGLALYQTREKHWQRVVIAAILVLILFTNLHAFSKGGLISLMGGAAVYIYMNPYYSGKRLRTFVTYLILSISLLIVVFLTSQEGLGRFGANPVATRKGSSLGLRFEWWRHDLRELIDSSWLGMGVGQLSKYDWGYLQNTYFAVFTDLGLIGGGIFVILVLVYLSRLSSKIKRCSDPYFYTVSLAFSCTLIIYAIHTLIDFGYLLRIPWLLAGFAMVAANLGCRHLKEANT